MVPFTDIGNSQFKDDIEWLWENNITDGTTATTFSPKDVLTRGQMAKFLRRANAVAQEGISKKFSDLKAYLLEYIDIAVAQEVEKQLGAVLPEPDPDPEPPPPDPDPEPEPEPPPVPNPFPPGADRGNVLVTQSGTEGNPIVIEGGTANEILFADGVEWIVVRGVQVAGRIGTKDASASHIVIENCEANAIWMDPKSSSKQLTDWVIEYNDIPNCRSFGIALVSYNEWAPIKNVQINGNKIGPMAGGDDAIRLHNVENVDVTNNEVFGVFEDGSHNDGLQTVHGAQALTVAFNWFHDGQSQPIFVGKDGMGREYRDLWFHNNLVERDLGPMHTQAYPFSGIAEIHNNTFGEGCGFSIRREPSGGNWENANVFDNTTVAFPNGDRQPPPGVNAYNNGEGAAGCGWRGEDRLFGRAAYVPLEIPDPEPGPGSPPSSENFIPVLEGPKLMHDGNPTEMSGYIVIDDGKDHVWRNVRLRGRVYVKNGSLGIFDSEIDGVDGPYCILGGGRGVWVERTWIHGAEDGIKNRVSGHQVTITDLSPNYRTSPHGDCIQLEGTAPDVAWSSSFFDARYTNGKLANAVVMQKADFSTNQHMVMVNCYANGGNYTFFNKPGPAGPAGTAQYLDIKWGGEANYGTNYDGSAYDYRREALGPGHPDYDDPAYMAYSRSGSFTVFTLEKITPPAALK